MPLTGSCLTAIKNPGAPQCATLFDATQRVWFQSLRQSDGATLNEINLSANLNKALFDGLMGHKDSYQRIIPFPILDKFEKTQTESVTVENDFSVEYFIRNGDLEVVMEYRGTKVTPALVRSAESLRGLKTLGIYQIDKYRNLGYSRTNTGKARPIPIIPGSLNIVAKETGNNDTALLTISFSVSPTESYGNFGVVPASQFASDVVISDYEGLIDIYAKFTSVTTTGCAIELYALDGAEAQPNRLTGLVTNKFVSPHDGATGQMRRISPTPINVAVTATEQSGSNAGIYNLVWAAQTTGAILQFDVLEAGFDFGNVRAVSVTIP